MDNPNCKQMLDQLLDNKPEKKKTFKNWFTKDIKITRKQDFIKSWQWFKNDTQEIKKFKEALRIISLEFFQNYSEIYLLNSKKL